MPIPDYQSFMTPLLDLARDQKEHSLKEAYDRLADHFGLTEEDKAELLPSGRQERYRNRIGWARTYLSKAGLLENTRRGHFRITERGLEELQEHPDEISTPYLKKYDEFLSFQTPSKTAPKEPGANDGSALSQTPEEAIEMALGQLNENLASELLSTLHQASPPFFEQLVVDVLVAMGYGGSRKEAAQRTKTSGDGGIDGIIKEDRLGLDTIYVQAKRWENAVGRPEIQKFVGALQGKRAPKGIFITTSSFTKEAEEYASQVQNTVVLVDGVQLAQLMLENGIGTSTIGVYKVQRVDSDYFYED